MSKLMRNKGGHRKRKTDFLKLPETFHLDDQQPDGPTVTLVNPVARFDFYC